MGLRAEPPNSESRYWDKGSLLPVSGSLIARKFSLLRRLGNSVAKRLNFPSKAEALWLSQKRKWRISLYFPRPDWRGPLPTMMGGRRRVGEWIDVTCVQRGGLF